jgi:hypothetical protein
MSQLHGVVFSSGKTYPIAEAVKQNLTQRGLLADTWRENFFDLNNTAPLNTFLKKLLCFDFAVLILGNDDLRIDPDGGAARNIPRDNVIFELGATMARMGTQKTFLLSPREPNVTLPSYFRGLDPLFYDHRSNDDQVAGTAQACSQIADQLRRLDEDAFHSDLPAIGLAFGYFYNFILPVHRTLREPQRFDTADSEAWAPENGFTVTTFLPERLMNRQAIDEFMQQEAKARNLHVQLKDGRDISVYVLPRTRAASLHILDIPTTLLTSEKVIRRVDSFWGGGDREFREGLVRREIAAFGRRLRGLIEEEQLSASRAFVEPLSNLEAHLARLPR